MDSGHGGAVAFRDIEGDVDGFVALNSFRRDFGVFESVVFVEVLNTLRAVSQQLFAIEATADDWPTFFNFNLSSQIATAQMMIPLERDLIYGVLCAFINLKSKNRSAVLLL